MATEEETQDAVVLTGATMEESIRELIRSEEALLAKLEELVEILLRRHKNCNISKTTGSSASIIGSVLTISGVLMAPFTAGASLLATGIGMAATVGGVVTNVGTDITKSVLNKKTAKELERLLETRLEKYKTTGEEISRVLKLGSKGFSVTTAAVDVFSMAQVYKFLYINRDIYGITGLSSAMVAKEQLGGLLLGTVRTQLNKGLAIIGLKLGARTLMVGLGTVFIALDVKNIIDCWKKEPKMCAQIETICEEIRTKIQQHNELLATEKETMSIE